MRHNPRHGALRWPLALLLGGAVSCAQALGLGEMNLQSSLGEPFRAEVALRTGDNETLTAECFKLIAQTHGADDIPWLARARLELTRGARTALRLSTTEPVADPVLMVGIRVGCGFELTREYTLLLEPVAISSPVATPPQPQGTEEVPQEAPPRRSKAPAPATEIWQVVEGETLASIAAALHPRSRSAQRRFVAAAARANPDVFPDPDQAAQQPLADGTSLALPALLRTAAPAARLAAPSPAPTGETRSAPPRRTVAPPRPAAAAPSQDRLSIGGGTDGDAGLRLAPQLDLARAGTVSETRRELLRQEQRLLASLEDTIVEQLSLADKIQRLEQTLAGLNRGLAEIDSKLPQADSAPPAVAVAPPAAAPEAPKAAPVPAAAAEAAQPARWPDWLLLALLAAAVVALLLVLRARARRREPVELPIAEAEPALEPRERTHPQVSEVDFPLEADAPMPPPRQLPQREPAAPMPGQAMHEDHAIDVAEHESALELAEIMLSFGRVQGAAQTLADYIEANPKQAVRPWLKLLEVYRNADMRAEFDTLARRMNQTFNVAVPSWDEAPNLQRPESIEDYPHAMARIEATWGSEECLEYLHHLLRDNRSGTRLGFPMPVLHDLMLLIGMLEELAALYPDHSADANLG